MIVLDATTRSLQIALGAGHSVNALNTYSTYRDLTTTAYTPGAQRANSNGTTPATIISAPGSSTQRVVDHISIFNADGITHTVGVVFNDNGTQIIIFLAIIGSQETLQYNEGDGWCVLQVNGAKKVASGAANQMPITGISVTSITSNVVNNNASANTIADVTGLSFPVVAGNRYWFRFVIHYDAAAGATGSRWSINGPAVTDLNYRSEYSLTTTTRTLNESLSAYDNPAAANATSPATGSNMAIIEGFILPSADGTVIARFASEVSSSAITALRGSFVQWAIVG